MLHFGIRTVAVLMLLAGASMGIFAGSLIARDRAADTNDIPTDAILEQKVRYYREFFELDPGRTEMVRQTLVTHKRRMRDALQVLRSANSATFQAIVAETESRLMELCRPPEPAPPAPGR